MSNSRAVACKKSDSTTMTAQIWVWLQIVDQPGGFRAAMSCQRIIRSSLVRFLRYRTSSGTHCCVFIFHSVRRAYVHPHVQESPLRLGDVGQGFSLQWASVPDSMPPMPAPDPCLIPHCFLISSALQESSLWLGDVGGAALNLTCFRS
jgi:hypothetical protein